MVSVFNGAFYNLSTWENKGIEDIEIGISEGSNTIA